MMPRRLSENFRKITLPLHLIGIVAAIWLTRSGEWSRLFYALPFWVLFSGFGISIGYHRLLSHRAFPTSTFIRRSLALLGIYGGQGSPIFWVATHRGLHHPYSDGERDPHSPQHGLWHAFMGWQIYFDRSRFSPRLAIDLLRDPFLKFISIHYHRVYWILPVAIFVIDWRLALGSLVPALLLAVHQENIVNTFCHLDWLGYRNHETSDHSKNLWFLGIIFWGQALHNNHHKFPQAWNFATEPYEFDPCSLIVPFLIREAAENKGSVASGSE